MNVKNALSLVVVGTVMVSVSIGADQNTVSNQTPEAVDLNAIEENPSTYKGKTVKVSGEVQEVLGPRVFTIDEREWIDLDGEIPVLLPSPLVAMLNENDRVTVVGTVRPLLRADLEREWGIFDLTPELELELSKRFGIVATAVTSDSGENFTLRMTTSPASSANAITDLNMLSGSRDEQLVGRPVNLQNARVSSIAVGGGFWVDSGNERLFVLPGLTETKVTVGQNVAIQGHVMEMPEGVKDRLGNANAKNERIYVIASQVK